jgi:glycosyltransferase involved in cell wall biosynthesis
MKIGIFTETYHPTVNGVVVSIDTFMHVLEREGHQYYIFAPANRKAMNDPKNVYRFPSFHFPNDSIYPAALPMPFQFAQRYFPLSLIRQLDVIHIQHNTMMGQYGLSFAERYNIPSVYTYHTMVALYADAFPIIGALAIPILNAITRFTANRADRIITPTPSVKKYLQSIGVTKKITPLPTGILTDLYKRTNQQRIRESYHIPLNQEILLFVGRLAAEKNVFFLLEAFEQIRKTRPHTHLVLAGDGPDREKFEQWIRQHKLGRHITLTGFLTRKEVMHLFGSADLFVFPSVTDTQGIVIIEAMAAGAVPVAVDVLGPHDIIHHDVTGMLTPLNLEAFSATIIDLLADPKKRKQMSVAAQRAAEDYDADVTGHSMEKLYLSSHKS